jgi:hypothetical protein
MPALRHSLAAANVARARTGTAIASGFNSEAEPPHMLAAALVVYGRRSGGSYSYCRP